MKDDLKRLMREIRDLESDIHRVEDDLLRCKNHRKEEEISVRLGRMRRSLSKLYIERRRMEYPY